MKSMSVPGFGPSAKLYLAEVVHQSDCQDDTEIVNAAVAMYFLWWLNRQLGHKVCMRNDALRQMHEVSVAKRDGASGGEAIVFTLYPMMHDLAVHMRTDRPTASVATIILEAIGLYSHMVAYHRKGFLVVAETSDDQYVTLPLLPGIAASGFRMDS